MVLMAGGFRCKKIPMNRLQACAPLTPSPSLCMKIIIIGSPGAGKTSLALELVRMTGFPVLHLDKVWHATDYSDEARDSLRQTQHEFLSANENCIIDGNYIGTMELRIAQADMIIWMKTSRMKALYRVMIRSVKSWLGEVRPDMPKDYRRRLERFDREYWNFLKFIWHFPRDCEPKIHNLLIKHNKMDNVILCKDKHEILKKIEGLCTW